MAKLNPISRSNKLTSAQAAVLSAAAQRLDGALVLPARLIGNAASALGSSLIEKQLAREVRAKPGLPACRQDAETGKSFAMLITKDGRAAAPVPEAQETADEQDASPSTSAQVSDVRRSETEISEGWSAQTAADGLSTSDRNRPQSSPLLGPQRLDPTPSFRGSSRCSNGKRARPSMS